MTGYVKPRDEVVPDVAPFGELRWFLDGDRSPGTSFTLGDVIRVPKGMPHDARSVDARMVVAFDHPHRTFESLEEE